MKVVFVIFLLAIFSCKNKPEAEPAKNDFELYPSFSDTHGLKSQFFQERRAADNLFNLADLFNGTKDSFEIRIYPWEFQSGFREMLLFKQDSSGWKGFHYNSFTMPLDEYGKQVIHYRDQIEIGDSVFIVKQINPKCGWEKLADSIDFFQIKSLPTQDSIKNFKLRMILDGDGISIEIATKKTYRLIDYYNPDVYNYHECEQIIGFIKMLSRQLGNDYYWPRQWLHRKPGK